MIGRANLDGTGVDAGFLAAGGGAFAIAVDAAHIYWTIQLGSTIGRANLDGTGANQGFIATAAESTGVAVSPAVTPVLTSVASPGVSVGGEVFDTATLSGGVSPGGQLTFNLYGPGDADCAGAPVFTDTVSVAGNGVYESAGFIPLLAGVYRWTLSYSGDPDNNPVASACNAPNELVVVSDPGVPAPLLVSLSPSAGPAGTVVTILGEGLADATDVFFGDLGAAFTVLSDTQLRATAPMQPPLFGAARAAQGLGLSAPVVVVGPGGASNTLTFTYTAVVVSIPGGCDPLTSTCGVGAPAPPGPPLLAPPAGADDGPAVGRARMPNLRATVTGEWRDGTIRVTVRVLISKPRLATRWFYVRVRVPSLGQSRQVRVLAHSQSVRQIQLTLPGPASAVGKRVTARVDPTGRILETRKRDNSASARIT